MLRHKTETRPGLVAMYNIRPGNGVGLFLQPQSPHGALNLNHDYNRIAVKVWRTISCGNNNYINNKTNNEYV